MGDISVKDRIHKIKCLLGKDFLIDRFLRQILEQHIVKDLCADKKPYMHRTGTFSKRNHKCIYFTSEIHPIKYYYDKPSIFIEVYIYDSFILPDAAHENYLSDYYKPNFTIRATISNNSDSFIPTIIRDLKKQLERGLKKEFKDSDYSIDKVLWENRDTWNIWG